MGEMVNNSVSSFGQNIIFNTIDNSSDVTRSDNGNFKPLFGSLIDKGTQYFEPSLDNSLANQPSELQAFDALISTGKNLYKTAASAFTNIFNPANSS
ncbi:MAG: hypothetical protein MZV64_26845 [Ignavibacteriales bacterium]|nr:hypothetical protein [Ignavibacteriales bacterium]